MKKRFVAAIIGALTFTTVAGGVVGFGMGDRSGRAAVEAEKTVEIEELKADAEQAIMTAMGQTASAEKVTEAMRTLAHKAEANRSAASKKSIDDYNAKLRAEREKKAAEEKANKAAEELKKKEAQEKADREKREAEEKARKEAEEKARKEAEEREAKTAEAKKEIMNKIKDAKQKSEDGKLTEADITEIKAMLADAKEQNLVIVFTYDEINEMNLSNDEVKELKLQIKDANAEQETEEMKTVVAFN
ncbi:MAG: hypothetical protein MJ117_05735 [Lachnospiraceae bacterium]|nr:hypothetical protein [Lachnospiraceae bacterium]